MAHYRRQSPSFDAESNVTQLLSGKGEMMTEVRGSVREAVSFPSVSPPQTSLASLFSVKSHGLIFTGDNPRLILEGRKTQTRRLVSPQPVNDTDGSGSWYWKHKHRFDTHRWPEGMDALCPYGVAGDRLWVRETLWRHNSFGFPLGESTQFQNHNGQRVWSYAADRHDVDSKDGTIPSIHMPRWASRITLEITKVRVERLQDITSDDCIAEGVGEKVGTPLRYGSITAEWNRRCYAILWDSLHGKGAWDKNPWVWVIEFKRVP